VHDTALRGRTAGNWTSSYRLKAWTLLQGVRFLAADSQAVAPDNG